MTLYDSGVERLIAAVWIDTASFDDQPVAAPGKYLSDAWGSFEVFPMSSLSSTTNDNVLRQSAIGCPIVWHTHSASKACGDADPFTLL